jgi:hypothetical protein
MSWARHWVVLLPLCGAVAAAAVPLARYAEKNRQEGVAVDFLRDVHAAQQRFREMHGGYATELVSLTDVCGDGAPLLPPTRVDVLHGAGYSLQLRALDSAAVIRRDCRDRALAADYYVAASPRSSASPAQRAFAASGDGRIYVFFDGVAPIEKDMKGGLATPLETLNTFRIP